MHIITVDTWFIICCFFIKTKVSCAFAVH